MKRMSQPQDWRVPRPLQPKPENYPCDLNRALEACVGLRSIVPEDAFTADILGTERIGSGVLVREDGLILTIGYLITEAETIWLTLADGSTVEGHALGFDQETGFGLVQTFSRPNLPVLPLGKSGAARVGERVVLAASGGTRRALEARIVAKQEYAGYWEYVLDEAIFTAPAHPHWGGTGLINETGELIGIGSLQLQTEREYGPAEGLNMVVPIDLAGPVIEDIASSGRTRKPARPWLGLYATEIDGRIAVVGLAERGPAARAGIRTGDVIDKVAGSRPHSLAGFFRSCWSLGPAGVMVPMTVVGDSGQRNVEIKSADRRDFLKKPRLH
jgi:S1-C subfamily serine protease